MVANGVLKLAFDRCQVFFDLRIDEQHPCTAVIHDVADLFLVETKVDRHRDAAMSWHSQKQVLEAGSVVRHNRYSFTESNTEFVEACSELATSFGDLTKGQRRPRIGWLVRFIDDRDAIRIVELGTIDEGLDREWRAHRWLPLVLVCFAIQTSPEQS